MDTLILNIGISFLIGILLSVLLHVYFFKTSINELFMSSISAVTIASVIGITTVSLLFWNDDDFVADISLKKYLIPLAGSLIILFAAFSLNLFTTIIISLFVAIFSIYYTGIIIDFPYDLPGWTNTVLTIILLWLFTCSFYCLSGLTPFPQSQGLCVAIGFIILTALHTAPAIMGYSAALLCGILTVAFVRSKYQPFNHISTPVLGYIIAWFGLMSYQEHLLPCFITFSMYGVMECLIAVFRRIISFPKIQNVIYNTSLYRAYEESGSSHLVTRFIWSTDTMLIILGVFQINSSNTFSLPVFAAILCIWQQYRILNWQQPELSLKEAGKETITSIRKSLNILFKNSDDNKHTDDK